MQTTHRILFENANHMRRIDAEHVDLVVTSPPYPMIQMWDDFFSRMNPSVANLLDCGLGWEAFEAMHADLDPVWTEIERVLKPGGIACINVGDAVRSIGGAFRRYPNHSRILQRMLMLKFSPLPEILWRKPTNAPNKFMGSGMLPPKAYVTLEHEHVLILQKTGRRPFDRPSAKCNRRESAYFWEERNFWFSDLWTDLKGTGQSMVQRDTRRRSAAFPFEVPYRLINMFSVKGDMVLDPFLGTGTTLIAAMAAARHSIGFEVDSRFKQTIGATVAEAPLMSNRRIQARLDAHSEFINKKCADGYPFKHHNRHYGFAVMTGQETDLYFNPLDRVEEIGNNRFRVDYLDPPQKDLNRRS